MYSYLIIVTIGRKVKDQMCMQIISYIYYPDRFQVVQDGQKIYWVTTQVAGK